MGHYAKVLNSTVETVIVADADFFDTFVDTSPGTWIQTSYNTRGGIYYIPNSNPPEPGPDQSKALRANYAAIGGVYDQINDVFYSQQPYPSWTTISAPTWIWQPPVPYPNDGLLYVWDESIQNWVLFVSVTT